MAANKTLVLSFLLFSFFAVSAQQATFTTRPMDDTVEPTLHYAISVDGLYPNPVIGDILYIKGYTPDWCRDANCLTISVNDIYGKIFLESQLSFDDGVASYDIREWPPQYYFVKVYNEAGKLVFQSKFIKEQK